jgi:superfamily I DNA/RNA helicase
MLLLARDLARQAAATGADTGFDAVIVDEVQDLTCAGVQFLHALVGDRTILRYALAVVADDQFDDLESDPAMGLRNIEAGRPGGDVLEIVGDRDSQEQAMTAHLEDLHRDGDVRYGDMAVLVPTNRAAERWQRALVRHRVPAILLKDYAGVPCDAVKVGTFHRAKGLEFAWVFIPARDRLPSRDGRRNPRTSIASERNAIGGSSSSRSRERGTGSASESRTRAPDSRRVGHPYSEAIEFPTRIEGISPVSWIWRSSHTTSEDDRCFAVTIACSARRRRVSAVDADAE